MLNRRTTRSHGTCHLSGVADQTTQRRRTVRRRATALPAPEGRRQLLSQALHLLDPSIELREVVLGQREHGGAGRAARARQIEDAFDVVQRETQRLCVFDEGQPAEAPGPYRR